MSTITLLFGENRKELKLNTYSDEIISEIDINGREVKTLINGLRFISGVVSVDFDASDYAPGIYFYSLFVDGDRIDTKKMVLIK